MSTQQQAMIMDTILALRKAVKRKAYESDSDSSIDHNTNRGQKLKKKARFVRRGELAAQATGHTTYKEMAELSGYQRAILQRITPLVDDEGYEVESDDNEDRVQEAVARRDEDNPYASIHLEHLLAPLTSVTDLPNHPTMSRPYTSKALTELASQGCDLMHRENAALWQVKPLLTQLQGDSTWLPCGAFIQENDHELFTDTLSFLNRPAQSFPAADAPTPAANGESSKSALSEVIIGNGSHAEDAIDPNKPADGDVDMAEPNGQAGSEVEHDKGKDKEVINGDNSVGNSNDAAADSSKQDSANNGGEKEEAQTNGAPASAPVTAEGEEHHEETPKRNGKAPDVDGDVEMSQEKPAQDSGTTSEKPADIESYGIGIGNGALALPVPGIDMDEPFIHPLFLAPRSAHPDRNIGLPENEAEDVRRLVQLYVQKQEEICRGAQKLYEGLLKADRYRKTVLQWSKAEAHCGSNRDMSDGEDWYDKDEWGLTEDLKKGQDEEEEDTTQQQQQKKTRNRR